MNDRHAYETTGYDRPRPAPDELRRIARRLDRIRGELSAIDERIWGTGIQDERPVNLAAIDEHLLGIAQLAEDAAEEGEETRGTPDIAQEVVEGAVCDTPDLLSSQL